MGLLYIAVCFCALVRGNGGLNMDLNILKIYISEGGVQSITPHRGVPPHIVIPLHVRFKGERG